MAEITRQNANHQESHRIIRSDGREDSLTRAIFKSYDTAYDALDRYYRDFCCSDDDRIEYTIVTETSTMARAGTVSNRTEGQKRA